MRASFRLGHQGRGAAPSGEPRPSASWAGGCICGIPMTALPSDCGPEPPPSPGAASVEMAFVGSPRTIVIRASTLTMAPAALPAVGSFLRGPGDAGRAPAVVEVVAHQVTAGRDLIDLGFADHPSLAARPSLSIRPRKRTPFLCSDAEPRPPETPLSQRRYLEVRRCRKRRSRPSTHEASEAAIWGARTHDDRTLDTPPLSPARRDRSTLECDRLQPSRRSRWRSDSAAPRFPPSHIPGAILTGELQSTGEGQSVLPVCHRRYQ